jgi:hypothetical protein
MLCNALAGWLARKEGKEAKQQSSTAAQHVQFLSER